MKVTDRLGTLLPFPAYRRPAGAGLASAHDPEPAATVAIGERARALAARPDLAALRDTIAADRYRVDASALADAIFARARAAAHEAR